MMRSVFAGVSGLKNHQTRMDVIGNNISNVNTTGFKSSRVTFVDALSQTMSGAASPKTNIGGTNPKQVGLGSSVGSIDLMFQDGSVQSTGKNTDLCLTGNGLFVVKNGNEKYYTRDGAFEFDAEGNYVLPGSGLFVQGWMGKDGVVDTTTSTGNITVAAGKSMEAKPTSLINYANNLNANVPMVTGLTGGINVLSKVIPAGDVTTAGPLTVTIDGTDYTVTGVAGVSGYSGDIDVMESWTVRAFTDTTATTIDIVDSKGNVVTLTPTASPSSAIPAGSAVAIGNIIPKSNVTPASPLTIVLDGAKYTVERISENIDLSKKWNVAAAIAAGSLPASSVTITDGVITTPITLTLSADTPIESPVDTTATVTTEADASIATTTNPVTVSLSDGTSIVQTNGTYQIGSSMPITTTVNIYDSLGGTHEIPVYFVREGEVKDGVVNSIDKWIVSLEPDSSVKKGQPTTYEFIEDNGTKTTVTMEAAEIQFTSSGKLVMNSTGSNPPDTIKNALVKYTLGSIGTDDTLPGEPVEQQITIDFTSLTQFSGNNTINGSSDGNASGTLKEIQIDTSGVITGVYTNGIRQAEAQVAVAQFTNATGLTKTGNSLYQESNNSGQANIKTAADLGVTITPSALEMSNVDVANEFADMIVTQRGFQSNSKIVTVGDEMLETIINMKR